MKQKYKIYCNIFIYKIQKFQRLCMTFAKLNRVLMFK